MNNKKAGITQTINPQSEIRRHASSSSVETRPRLETKVRIVDLYKPGGAVC